VPRLHSLLILAVTAPVLTACGIAFSDGPQGNDFFTSLRVSGDKTAGLPLTAAVAYETIYPAPIEIVCELRQGSTTLRELGRGMAPAVLPEREPEDDGVPGNFSIDFTVDAAGRYKVECFTPLDALKRDDGTLVPLNYIIEEFSVSGP
jgi:hypothetical protein